MAETKKKLTKKVIEKKIATTEDLILGNEVKDVVKTIITYEDKSIKYKVTNLRVNNNPITVTGDVIETFIGANNQEAREQLKSGAKTVITKDYHKNDEYKIEVV